MDSEIEDSIVRSVLGKTKLSVSEITCIKQMFKYYDTDNDGHLTRDESTKLYRELGYEGPADNWGNTKRIPMEQFLLRCGGEKKLMLQNPNDLEAQVSHVFKIIDNPRMGKGDAQKLEAFMRDVDINAPPETIQRMAEIISMYGDAEFSEEDLLTFTGNKSIGKVEEESNSSLMSDKKEDKMTMRK